MLSSHEYAFLQPTCFMTLLLPSRRLFFPSKWIAQLDGDLWSDQASYESRYMHSSMQSDCADKAHCSSGASRDLLDLFTWFWKCGCAPVVRFWAWAAGSWASCSPGSCVEGWAHPASSHALWRGAVTAILETWDHRSAGRTGSWGGDQRRVILLFILVLWRRGVWIF